MLKYSKNSGASKGHQKYKNGSVNGERGGCWKNYVSCSEIKMAGMKILLHN